MHIHYDIQRQSVKTDAETIELSAQWSKVIAISHQKRLGETERARLAFNMVDYLTSDDLPFRLLITRAPQAMTKIAEETQVYKSIRVINGKKSGVIYSKQRLVTPKEINYTSSYLATRVVNGTPTPLSSGNLLDCLKAGDVVTPLDGILFLGCKRIAANISKLKQAHSDITMKMDRIEVSDSFTGTKRMMASYRLG